MTLVACSSYMLSSLSACLCYVYIPVFLASSRQLYAELWLDFFSFAGFLVTLEMTSRAAGLVPDTDLAATGYLHPPRSTYPLGWAFFFIALIVFSSLLGCIDVATC